MSSSAPRDDFPQPPQDPVTPDTVAPSISGSLIWLLATACGLIVANIYYAQPLAGLISEELAFPKGATGLVVTLTQIGYGAGLLLIVPLADLIENRKLVAGLLILVMLGLVGAALASSAWMFLTTAFLIGLFSVAAQVLVPLGAHLAPPEARGHVVGKIMSGLMLGIMLARPVASLLAEFLNWQAVFFLSAVAMCGLSIIVSRRLPVHEPATGIRYGALLGSMWHLLWNTPVLQRRALYHACMFGAFSLFWTTAPLYLAGPQFGLSQAGIALFALAGVAGAIAAPIAGRMADRGHSRLATLLAMVLAVLAFGMTHLFAPQDSHWALPLMVVAAIVLDYGVTTNLVVGQRAIFHLGTASRGRLNGLFMAIFFLGGAAGSALGGWAYAHGGWMMASTIGAVMPVLALLYALTERR